jgi:hypothetical protein
MTEPPRPGEQATPTPAGAIVKAPGTDQFVHATVQQTLHVAEGNVLWTLSSAGSTAQARRWITATGFELEMLIWSGAHVDGQEELCWSQLFASDELLAETSLAKKRQLEAAGWLEDLDAAAR